MQKKHAVSTQHNSCSLVVAINRVQGSDNWFLCPEYELDPNPVLLDEDICVIIMNYILYQINNTELMLNYVPNKIIQHLLKSFDKQEILYILYYFIGRELHCQRLVALTSRLHLYFL